MNNFDYIIFFIKCAMYIGISFKISNTIVQQNNHSYSLRFINYYYTFQLLIIAIYVFTNNTGQIDNQLDKSISVLNLIDEIGVYYLIAQVSTFAIIKIFNPLFHSLKRKKTLTEVIMSGKSKLVDYYLTFTAIIFMIYPFASSFGAIGYAIQICFNFSLLIPFVAGAYALQNKKITILWVFALTLLFVFSVIGGSRGVGFLPVALFIFGYYYNIKDWKYKIRYLLIIGIIGIPGALFFSFIGYFRNIVGRVPFKDITIERAITAYNKYEKLKGTTKFEKLIKIDKKQSGINRLINQVNISVLSLVPNKVDYIGLEGLDKEFKYAFDLAFLSGTTVKDRVNDKVSNYRMSNYGYYANEKASVECSIFTEGWIRFGLGGVILNHLMYASFLFLAESIIALRLIKKPKVNIFYTIGLIFVSYQAYAYNLFPNIRNLFVSLFFVTVLLVLITQVKIFLRSPAKPYKNGV